MKLPISLMLGAWLGFLAGVVYLVVSPPHETEAHVPFNASGGSVHSFGSLAIRTNWENGWQRPNSNTRTIAVVDFVGLSSTVKNSAYYPSQAWNAGDNLHTWVVKDVTPVEGGSAVYIYNNNPPYTIFHPSLTHVHLFTWCWFNNQWNWHEDNQAACNWIFIGDIHVSSGTLGGQPNSIATVMTHEVGHVMGLKDEAHGGLMDTPNPGIQLPSFNDRRSAELCIPATRTYPC